MSVKRTPDYRADNPADRVEMFLPLTSAFIPLALIQKPYGKIIFTTQKRLTVCIFDGKKISQDFYIVNKPLLCCTIKSLMRKQ